jgi:hypothetical protein
MCYDLHMHVSECGVDVAMETPRKGNLGARGRTLWKKGPGSASKVKALFEQFGLHSHSDTLSAALVLQSSGKANQSFVAGGSSGNMTIYPKHYTLSKHYTLNTMP